MMICELDPYRIWTGRSAKVTRQDPVPKGWVRAEPPVMPEGMLAWFSGEKWRFRYAYPAQKLLDTKQAKREEINAAYTKELDAILAEYPNVETKTWDKQEQEARAWAADNTVTTPLLTEIGKARGMTLAELVPRVIAKADAWMQLSGAATGKRQKLIGEVDGATTVEQVEAIAW